MASTLLLYGSICAIIAILYGATNWRRSVKLALFIVVIEGVIRKWLFPQFSDLVYFFKDLLLIGAYIGYYFPKRRIQKITTLSFSLRNLIFFIFLWELSLAILNPRLGSSIVGIVGLRGYLINVPLIWMLVDMFRSEKELYQFIRNHLLLTIPSGLLGIVQFFSPPSSMINIYAGSNAGYIATFGNSNQLVRISGPFPYLDSYVVYLMIVFCLLIPLYFYDKQKWWRLTYIFELSLVVVNLFMTGSRSGIYVAILFLAGYLFVLSANRFTEVLQFAKQLVIPTIVAILLISQLTVFRSAFDAFVVRATSAGDSVTIRVLHTLYAPFDFVAHAGLYGYGTGATQGASKAIGNILGLPPGEVITVPVEEEPGRIMLEIGPIGFILWYGLRFVLVIALWSTFRSLRHPFLKQLALTAFLLHALQFADQLVTHPVFSLYYWFLSGFVFLLPNLEQQSLRQHLSVKKKSDNSYATVTSLPSPSRS